MVEQESYDAIASTVRAVQEPKEVLLVRREEVERSDICQSLFHLLFVIFAGLMRVCSEAVGMKRVDVDKWLAVICKDRS